MPISVTLSPLVNPVPGQAILNIRGWEESSTALEFAIQRGRDEFYLQQAEQWSSNPYWFKVDRFDEVSDNLQLVVGKDVVDPLLGASSDGALQFKLRLQDGSAEEEQTMRLRDGLLTSLAGAEQGGYTSSVAGGQLQQPVSTTPLAGAEITPSQPDLPDLPDAPPATTSEPIPVVSQAPAVPKKNTLAWLLPLLLLLLIAIAAGGWFFLNKGKNAAISSDSVSKALGSASESSATENSAPAEMPATESIPTDTAETTAEVASGQSEPTESEPTESTATESVSNDSAPTDALPPAAVAPCSAENMASLSELMFVQGCVKSVPSSAEMLKTIEAAKASKHCGIAQRLYAHRGQAGDVKVATAYAHEYDPKYHQASDCFKAPDAATAAYWYETILSQEPDNTEAKQRFEELKP